jgi:3-hydroxyacyl-[acyl-carrier-protein] dehydratase
MSTDLLDPSPWILEQREQDDGTHCTTLQLPPHYIGFQGHFPDQPILPGMYHVMIATRLIGNCLGKELQLKQLTHGKFMAPLVPDQEFSLTYRMESTEDGIAASVKVTRNDTQSGVSKFKMLLQAS